MSNPMPQLAEESQLAADELKDWKDSFDDVASRFGREQAIRASNTQH